MRDLFVEIIFQSLKISNFVCMHAKDNFYFDGIRFPKNGGILRTDFCALGEIDDVMRKF